MADLVDFAKRVSEQLARVNREPHWKPGEAEQYMLEVNVRRQRFEQVATRLATTVIQPRLEVLASYFANSSAVMDQPSGHCSYWFGYSERFPVSSKLTFRVEHDVRFEKVAVCYEARMMPVFIKIMESDKFAMPLDEVNDDSVATWVEERLLDFLDAYLQVDRGGEDFRDESVIDPVCGMRISRSSAAASDTHRGHPYFFCSPDCQERFARDPIAFVEVGSGG
jgi:YHS domain-containing protein